MKQFTAFVKKEFYHIFRDRRTMLILLLMPVVLIILFGFALNNEVKNVQVAIFDPSKDAATTRIIEKIKASENFVVTHYFNSHAEIENAFRENRISLAVVFSEAFGENLRHTGEAAVQLIADATDPNHAVTANGYMANIITDYQQEVLEQYNIPFRIKAESRMLYNPQLKGGYYFVPGVMGLILMLICSMMTSVAVVREKESGTMEVLLASPMKPVYIILSKLVPYITLSLVNLITILLLSIFVLNVPVAGSLFWLMLLSIIFILVALSLGMFISTMVDTQIAATLASGMALMVPVMLLSGMIFPIESMPKILQWISHIIPARWYIAGVRKLMIEGLSVTFAIKEFIILSVMALFLFTVSLKRFKIRLE